MLNNLDQEFVQFWAAYPRKRNKIDARKAFDIARRSGFTLDTMLTALDWQRRQAQWVRDGGQYIPYPASWLRDGGYDDEPDEPIRVPVKEFWYDECLREHGGTCTKRWQHETRMQDERARERGEVA